MLCAALKPKFCPNDERIYVDGRPRITRESLRSMAIHWVVVEWGLKGEIRRTERTDHFTETDVLVRQYQ